VTSGRGGDSGRCDVQFNIHPWDGWMLNFFLAVRTADKFNFGVYILKFGQRNSEILEVIACAEINLSHER